MNYLEGMKLTHNLHTMTIGRYGRLDESKDLSLLKTGINLFPIEWFPYQKTLDIFATALDNGVDKQLLIEIARLKMLNKIQKLETWYAAIHNLIVLKPDNDQWKVVPKKKTNLAYYLKLVRELALIDIKDLVGLRRLEQEVDRLNNKFLERYPKDKKKSTKKAVPFTRYAKAVYLLLEADYNPNMSMYEFLQDTVLADQKARNLEAIKRKHGR